MSLSSSVTRPSVVWLRTMTVEPVIERMRSGLAAYGLEAETTVSGYGPPEHEAHVMLLEMDTVDVVVVAWDARDVVPDSTAAATGRAEDTAVEVDRLIRQGERLMTLIRSRQPSAVVVWLGLAPIQHLSHGASVVGRSTVGNVVATGFNAWLRDLAASDVVSVVDVGALVTQIGQQAFFDERLWLSGHMPWGVRGVAAVGDSLVTILMHRLGRVRKALILDCDNTLWGGVLDEVGIEGIALGDHVPGNAFRAFQRDVLELKAQGVMLGLCTRNDEDSVKRVFETHPGMVLRWSDIAVVRANWGDKATSLIQIAADLNIATDALVFVDDSDHEIDLVSRLVPDVLCVKVDASRPSRHMEALREVTLFDVSGGSAGVDRTVHAHQQSLRKQFMQGSGSMSDYQEELGTGVTVREGTDLDAARIREMVNRTNQFHATGLRHSPQEVAEWISRSDVSVRITAVSDRIGSLGDVGVCVIDRSPAHAHVRAFLLSCRAIGRGIEWAMMEDALGIVDDAELQVVVAPSGRNRLALEFAGDVSGVDLGAVEHGEQICALVDPEAVARGRESWTYDIVRHGESQTMVVQSHCEGSPGNA